MDETRPLYRIKDWERIYVVSDARRKVAVGDRGNPLPWVAMPTKFDGRGFKNLMKRPDGLEVLGAFLLMVEIAANCPTRGSLIDEDGPLTALDLCEKTGASEESFKNAFQVLSEKEFRIVWLEVCHTYPTSSSATYDNVRNENVNVRGAADAARPSPHRELVQFFTTQWAAKYQAAESDYGFSAKDGAHISWILKKTENPESAKAIIEAYLADDDPFFTNQRHSLGTLVSQFRRFKVPDPSPKNGDLHLQFTEVPKEQLKP